MIVHLHNGDTTEVTEGVIDGGAVHLFTQGHCHSLAAALHTLTGLPFALFWDANAETDDEQAILHVAVVKGGECLDIHGYTTLTQMVWDGLDDAGYEIGSLNELNEDLAADPNTWLPLDIDLAMPFAKKLLEET